MDLLWRLNQLHQGEVRRILKQQPEIPGPQDRSNDSDELGSTDARFLRHLAGVVNCGHRGSLIRQVKHGGTAIVHLSAMNDQHRQAQERSREFGATRACVPATDRPASGKKCCEHGGQAQQGEHVIPRSVAVDKLRLGPKPLPNLADTRCERQLA